MKLTISILEDQPTEAEYLKTLLHKWSSQENCELEIAEYCSGEEFFTQNNTDTYKRFSVFFLDIQMKEMNGLDVAKKTQERGIYRTYYFSDCFSGICISWL